MLWNGLTPVPWDETGFRLDGEGPAKRMGERMDPIEESVRRALEGGRPAEQSFRRSIYAASTRAVERTIASRGLGPEEAEAERARLADIVDRVEAEYFAYYGGDGVGGDASPVEEPMEAAAAPHEDRPPFEPVPARASPAAFEPNRAAAEPSEAPAAAPGWTPGAGRSAPRAAGRRAPGKGTILALVFLVVLVIVAWMFLRSGPATDSAATSVSPEAGLAEPATGTAPNWIDVFAGADLERVSTPSGGRVSAVGSPERPALRLAGPEGAEGEILLDLGPGLVGEIAGSNVRVELVAGSPDGNLREFSVRCLFAQVSVCERQRFATSMPEEAFIFDVEIPAGVSTPASLALGPGLSDDGPDFDLYSVRMRIL